MRCIWRFMVLISPLLNVLKLFHFFLKSQLMNWLSQKIWILNLQPASKSPIGLVKCRLFWSQSFWVSKSGAGPVFPGDTDVLMGIPFWGPLAPRSSRSSVRPAFQLAGVTLLHMLNDPEGLPCCPSSHGNVILRGSAGGERIHGRGVAQSLVLRNCKRPETKLGTYFCS